MKTLYSYKNITLPVGSDRVTEKISIKRGQVVACALLTSLTPSSPVDLQIQDDAGNDIHPMVSHLEYKPTNGAHKESRKEIFFEGNQDIVITAQSASNIVGSDFAFQMLFYVENDN
jgi:hypothetical protein